MWLALNWGGEKEGKWREDWGDKKSYRLFSFCAFPSLSFPFFCTRHVSYCPLSLFPLRFSPPLPPLLPLFAKDGHKMLWTGCKKVIALSPTLTYVYMYTGVRYSWTATTAISLQQPPLQWPLFLADSLYSQSCFNLSTVATFFCSQSGCCREVQL